MLQQVSEATNDWGKTIESPANQTRILSEQWDRLTRTLGNIFLPIVYKILPYVNAILMVLTEIAQIIANIVASFLGFSEEELNFGAGVDANVVDLTEDLNAAADSVDNLKDKMSGLRSFDKLINITTPKNTGTSGISGTGVSADILNMANKAMDEYNSKLENVQMKATKIRDRIMEWLGFTKEVDEETGKVSFKFDHITSGTILGALAVGGSIFTGIMKIVKILKNFGIIGSGGGTSLLGKLLSGGGFTSLIDKIPLIALIVGEIQAIVTDEKLHGYFKEILDTIDDLGIDFDDIFTKIKDISSFVGGTFQAVWDLYVDTLKVINDLIAIRIKTGLKVIVDILKGDFLSALEDIKEGFADIASLFDGEIVAKYFKKGADLFGLSGLPVSDVSKSIGEKLEEATTNFNKAVMYEFDEIDLLEEKLLSLVDTNGKVSDSNKEVAEYIIKDLNKALGTEYELQGNVIKLNGKEIDSNKDLESSIEKVIKKKKLQILLDAYKEDYIKALKDQKEQQEKINELEALYAMYEHDSSEEGKIKRDIIMAQLEDSKNKMKKNQQAIIDYDNLIKTSATDNIKEIDKTLQKYGIETEKSVNKNYDNISKGAQNIVNNATQLLNNLDFKWSLDFETKKAQNALTNLASNFVTTLQNNPLLTLINGMKTIFKSDGGVYSGGQWHNIARYDGGGTPKTGQLFWARENGLPEMVGQIGGHTAVMNNDQIVGSVANGVYRAVKEATIQSTSSNSGIRQIDIYLDKNHKLASYTLEELQSMAKSNGKAITIS